MLIGLASAEMAAAFWLTIGLSLFCVIYGAVNWNNDGRGDEVGPSDD